MLLLRRRRGFTLTLLATAPAVFCTTIARDAAGFVALRAVTGLALSNFVASQYWCYKM